MGATAGQAVMTPAGGLVEGSQSTGGTEPRGRFEGFSRGFSPFIPFAVPALIYEEVPRVNAC